MAKIWKSDGEEQNYLEGLFQSGIITADTKPGAVQADHVIFAPFKPHVFRTHFNMTKKKFQETDETSELTDALLGKRSSKNPGIEVSETINKFFKKSTTTTTTTIKFGDNSPAYTYVYFDPTEEIEKVVVMVSIFSGAKNVDWEVDDSGTKATLYYDWPQAMCDVYYLHKTKNPSATSTSSQINPSPITSPAKFAKIQAHENALQNFKRNKDNVPRGSIEVHLPLIVQTNKDARKLNGYHRPDGSYIAEIELNGRQSNYSITQRDTRVRFNN